MTQDELMHKIDDTSAEEQLQKVWRLLDKHFDTGLLSDEDIDRIDEAITSYTKQRELALLERLEKHTKEQIAASKENMQYHQDKTKNERLIKEWLGGVQAMELFILPAIQKEKEKL